MKIEITIPVLNEEETLEENILKINSYLSKSIVKDYAIVIADNGSTDNTEYIGRAVEEKLSQVKYIKIDKKGVGLALRTSWLQSDSDIVSYMDLDIATDLVHIEDVYRIFNQNDIDAVNGSRLLKESRVSNRTLLREITSRSFNFIAKKMLSYSISDGMCGFKFFKRETAIKLIDTGIVTDGWIFATEILAKMFWSNYNIVEIPVRWTDDRNSKVKIISLSISYIKHLYKLYRQKKTWTYKVNN